MVQKRAGSDDTVGMMVRMPVQLRDRIKAAAEANGRSQNSEIVATLEEKYPAPAPQPWWESLFEWAQTGRDPLAPEDEERLRSVLEEELRRIESKRRPG